MYDKITDIFPILIIFISQGYFLIFNSNIFKVALNDSSFRPQKFFDSSKTISNKVK